MHKNLKTIDFIKKKCIIVRYFLCNIVFMHTKLNLDQLDLSILEEMMNNADISYAELGKKLFCERRHHSCSNEKVARHGHC